MPAITLFIGDKFSSWTVIDATPRKRHDGRRGYFCRCECGTEKVVSTTDLVKGLSRSCYPCSSRRGNNATHRKSKTPFYVRWASIISRCYNPNVKCYVDYGARGITVCERWRKFENFHEDMFPSWKEGLQLDRIDNNKGYSKENCRWATRRENMQNTRANRNISIDGITLCLAEWERLTKIHPRAWYKLFEVVKSLKEDTTSDTWELL